MLVYDDVGKLNYNLENLSRRIDDILKSGNGNTGETSPPVAKLVTGTPSELLANRLEMIENSLSNLQKAGCFKDIKDPKLTESLRDLSDTLRELCRKL